MENLNNKGNNFWKSGDGFFVTIGIGIGVFTSFSILQSIFLVAYGFHLENWDSNTDIGKILTTLAYDGDAISFSEIPAVIISTFLILFFTKLRKPISPSSFLGLKSPTLVESFQWLSIMIIVISLMELSYIVFERDTPDFMKEVFATTDNFPMLWLAVIIAAPIFEEFLFRGYLLEGINQSPIGPAGAIVITSAMWAVIHLQYESYEIITIFLIGIVLSIAKLKTKSLYIPIAMHMLMNLTASIMMELS